MQIRFYRDPESTQSSAARDSGSSAADASDTGSGARTGCFEQDRNRLIGIETAGFSHQGQVWRLSTVENWQFVGKHCPTDDVAEKLKYFSRQVFQLFNA